MDEVLPNLLLAGVAKAGTTSLFSYLIQHPDIWGPRQKELDYFTPLREPGTQLASLENYSTHFHAGAGKRYRLDGSPSYAVGGAPVVAGIKAVLDRPRVIISLRDPVQRLWSAYTFANAAENLGGVSSFDVFVAQCEEARADGSDRRLGNRLMALSTGHYDEYLGAWLEAFGNDLRVVFAEDLSREPRDVLRDLFGWLGIDTGVADNVDVSLRNRTVYARSPKLARAVYAAKALTGRTLERAPALRRALRRLYGSVNTRSVEETMAPATRAKLEAHYRESTERTGHLLAMAGYERLPAWLRAE